MDPLPASPVDAPPAPAGEGCPPPLVWSDVLALFRRDSVPFELTAGRARLAGRTWGQGAPLYFIPGMGGTLELFSLTAYLLRDTFRCVLWNHPTEAVSSPGRTPRLDDYVDAWRAVMDHHHDTRCDLFATSFGSLVALRGMERFPERVGRAVIQGGFARRRLALAERSLIRLAGLLPIPLRRLPLRSFVQQHNHRRWFPPFDHGRFQFLLDDCGQVPVRALAQRAAVVRDTDLRPLLPRIAQPVLVMHCEGDGLVAGSCAAELEAGLPHAKSERVDNTGHLPYLTHPHRLAKLIRAFLA